MTDDPLYRQDDFLRCNVIECSNTYPRFNPASEVAQPQPAGFLQPDRPRLVTELQGGWFSDYGVGKQLSGDMGYTPAQITHVTLLAWALWVYRTNYYMMFGGTNLGIGVRHRGRTSYDYAAPIREWGGAGRAISQWRPWENLSSSTGEAAALRSLSRSPRIRRAHRSEHPDAPHLNGSGICSHTNQ